MCVLQGRASAMRGRTFSAPRKWLPGKGRMTIQFGCCYNYARDDQGREPGVACFCSAHVLNMRLSLVWLLLLLQIMRLMTRVRDPGALCVRISFSLLDISPFPAWQLLQLYINGTGGGCNGRDMQVALRTDDMTTIMTTTMTHA